MTLVEIESDRCSGIVVCFDVAENARCLKMERRSVPRGIFFLGFAESADVRTSGGSFRGKTTFTFHAGNAPTWMGEPGEEALVKVEKKISKGPDGCCGASRPVPFRWPRVSVLILSRGKGAALTHRLRAHDAAVPFPRARRLSEPSPRLDF